MLAQKFHPKTLYILSLLEPISRDSHRSSIQVERHGDVLGKSSNATVVLGRSLSPDGPCVYTEEKG